MRRLIKWLQDTDVWRPIVAMLLTLLFWVMVAACVAAQPPQPYADVAPEPQPQMLECGLSGEVGADFTLACTAATATPTATAAPTATPEPAQPAFWYFWCAGDARCSSGQYRVYWDRGLSLLRCARPQGEKVDRIADGYTLREGEGEPLAWVVTGADAGNGTACEGWVPTTFLRAAE